LAINNSTTAIAEIIKYPSNPDANATANAITRPVRRAAIFRPPFVRIVKSAFDALNASGQKYNFNSIPGGTFATRNDTRTAIKSLLDGTYETNGDSNGLRDNKLFGKVARISGTFGIGAAFKISKKVNIAFEERLTFVKDDLLDGQRWAATPIGDAVATTHYDTYNFLSVGLNINIF
jgi:hypothetical protein